MQDGSSRSVPPLTTRRLLRTGEAVVLARCHEATIRRAVRDGALQAVRLGGTGNLRIREDELERWLQPVQPCDAAGRARIRASSGPDRRLERCPGVAPVIHRCRAGAANPHGHSNVVLVRVVLHGGHGSRTPHGYAVVPCRRCRYDAAVVTDWWCLGTVAGERPRGSRFWPRVDRDGPRTAWAIVVSDAAASLLADLGK